MPLHHVTPDDRAAQKHRAANIAAGAPPDALALRVDEFARRVRVSRTVVYQMIAAGKLRSVMISGRRVIPSSEAHRLLNEGA